MIQSCNLRISNLDVPVRTIVPLSLKTITPTQPFGREELSTLSTSAWMVSFVLFLL